MPLVNLQGKVDPDVRDQFNEAKDASDAATYNQFVEMLLEAFLNPKTKQVEIPTPTAEQLEAIQLKENEIGRLLIQVDQLKDDLAGQIETTQQMEGETRQLKQQLESKPDGLTLAENQTILTFPPVIAAVLNKEAEIAKRQTGKDFSRQDILMNSFWDSITKGAAYPLKVWSANDLRQLKKQLEPKAE